MTLWFIVGLGLVVLGGIAIYVLQMPEAVAKKHKKKHEPVPEPPKDWQPIAERAERRVQAVEGNLRAAQNEIKERDRQLNELAAAVAGMRKQLDQEKAWREKEEVALGKDKKHERVLHEDLVRTRTSLDQEVTQRIKQEAELKDLRKIAEDTGAEVRKLTGQNVELNRKLTEALSELKVLRSENGQLKRKKEGEEWVLKSDFRSLEGMLKRARWEVDQFKQSVPSGSWPKALQSPAKVEPVVAPAAPVVTEVPAAVVPVEEPKVNNQEPS